MLGPSERSSTYDSTSKPHILSMMPYPSKHIQFQTAHPFLERLLHFSHLCLQGGHLILKVLHLALLILRRAIASSASGSLNFLEEIAASLFEILVIKSNVLRGVGIKVTIANRLGLHLPKAVKVKLHKELSSWV